MKDLKLGIEALKAVVKTHTTSLFTFLDYLLYKNETIVFKTLEIPIDLPTKLPINCSHPSFFSPLLIFFFHLVSEIKVIHVKD